MGHVINPITLKLGVTKFWNSTTISPNINYNYKYTLGSDYFIYKFLRGFFLLILFIMYNFGRKKIRMGSSNSNIIKTLFFKKKPIRMLIGKIKLFKLKGFNVLNIYIWDGSVEVFIRHYIYNIYSIVRLKLQVQSLQLFFLKKYKIKCYIFHILLLLYQWFKYKQVYVKKLKKKKSLILLLKFLFKKIKCKIIKLIKKIKNKLFMLINLILKNFVKVLNSYTFLYPATFLIKKQKFFFRKYKKLVKVKQMFISYYIQNLRAFLRYLFFKKRYRFYKKFAYVFYFYLESYYEKHLNLFLSFRHMHIHSLNASIMGKYICSRLLQHFELMESISPVIKDAAERPDILGFHLTCSGRFSRKDRATHRHIRLGKKPLNTFKGRLEYYVEKVFLKNSVVSIKLWLAKKAFVGLGVFHLHEYFSGFSLTNLSLYRKRFIRWRRKSKRYKYAFNIIKQFFKQVKIKKFSNKNLYVKLLKNIQLKRLKKITMEKQQKLKNSLKTKEIIKKNRIIKNQLNINRIQKQNIYKNKYQQIENKEKKKLDNEVIHPPIDMKLLRENLMKMKLKLEKEEKEKIK